MGGAGVNVQGLQVLLVSLEQQMKARALGFQYRSKTRGKVVTRRVILDSDVNNVNLRFLICYIKLCKSVVQC